MLGYQKEGIMAELLAEQQVSLNTEECEYLVGLLERTLKEARVEEHRTRTPLYRQHVVHQEELIAGILSKLGYPPA